MIWFSAIGESPLGTAEGSAPRSDRFYYLDLMAARKIDYPLGEFRAAHLEHKSFSYRLRVLDRVIMVGQSALLSTSKYYI